MPHSSVAQPPARIAAGDLISPVAVQQQYDIPETTQAVWRCTNRYGFRDLVIKVGTRVKYSRPELEAWLESRRAGALGASGGAGT